METYQLPQEEKAVFEHLKQPFAILQFVDKRFVILALSDGFCRLFGCDDREQAYFHTDRDRYCKVHPDDAERVSKAIVRFAEEGGSFDEIFRVKTRNSDDYLLIHASGEQVCTGTGVQLFHVWYSEEHYLSESLNSRTAETKRLRELNRTFVSLLDNIPGLTFTKDAGTGIYLACNQAFAKYAHKTVPDEVVGLTDAEIFDAVTAKHFVEDDQTAFSMEKPYIFFEDVPDAAGNQRQFQTTKLKYRDASGRLCLLGICQDVTDMVRIRRENATTKIAYKQARNTSIIYNHLAHALARDCMDLYYVNMDTEEYIEFHTDDEHGVLSEVRRDRDFFTECRYEVRKFVHPEDQQKFVSSMNRGYLSKKLDRQKVYELTYRRLRDGKPFYVQMHVSRMEDDKRFIVIAVSDIDELMRQRSAEERMQEERIIYARLHALTGNFICVYVVDPQTNRYREFSSTAEYKKSFGREKEGQDFFSSVRKAALIFAHAEDRTRFLTAFTKENVMTEIEHKGFFTLGYRIMMNQKPLHVQMKAAIVEEKEGTRLIVGLNDIDSQVRQEEEFEKRLVEAQTMAVIDALTGIKNKHAFQMAEKKLDRLIAKHQQPPFAIVMLDVNDLKLVNDTSGHQAGDQYLRDASRIICDIFKHSPVFRIGGDEFAVISQGIDYRDIEEKIDSIRKLNMKALQSGGIVLACGLAVYENDESTASVLERADQKMYQNKKWLKAAGKKNKTS